MITCIIKESYEYIDSVKCIYKRKEDYEHTKTLPHLPCVYHRDAPSWTILPAAPQLITAYNDPRRLRDAHSLNLILLIQYRFLALAITIEDTLPRVVALASAAISLAHCVKPNIGAVRRPVAIGLARGVIQWG